MLPLLKKKSDADGPLAVPSWHPNFRNYEKLPDIKVVRTAFFVNGAAAFLTLVLLMYCGFQEWQLRTLRLQLAEANDRIEKNKSGSGVAVAQFKRFQAEEAKIKEVDAFVKSKPIVSDLILRLGQTLPANIAFDKLELRDNGLALSLTVRGATDAAIGYANAFVEQLKADKELAYFDDFAIVNSARNASNGRLTVDLFLHLKPPAAKKP